MLSNRVHKALLTFQDDEAAETAKFAGMFDKFFDCLNISNSYVGKHSLNSFKNAYRKATDFRLEVSNIERSNGYMFDSGWSSSSWDT